MAKKEHPLFTELKGAALKLLAVNPVPEKRSQEEKEDLEALGKVVKRWAAQGCPVAIEG